MSDNRRLRKKMATKPFDNYWEHRVARSTSSNRHCLCVRVPYGFRCLLGPTVWLPCDYRLITVWFPVWFFTCVLLGRKSNGGHRLISVWFPVWFPCDFHLISVWFPFGLPFDCPDQHSGTPIFSKPCENRRFSCVWIIAISLRRLLADV